jgi:iron complex transport system ATP-binding protein
MSSPADFGKRSGLGTGKGTDTGNGTDTDTGTGTGLEAWGIEVHAGGRLIISGVDCTVATGSLVALIGPNGAGKSTLLRALAAVERPAAGTISFGGNDVLSLPRKERARLMAFVEQDASTELALSVEAVVSLGRLPHESLFQTPDAASRAIVAGALETTGMLEFRDRQFTSLSGGERQRVMLARALAQQPQLLLLDEPTNHLDISAQLETLALLTRAATTGTTVLAALHDLTLAAAWCSSVIVVDDGRVVAAGPTRSTLTAELIREVYGVEAVIVDNPITGTPVIAFSRLGA